MSIQFMVSYSNPDRLVVRTLSCNRNDPCSKPDLDSLPCTYYISRRGSTLKTTTKKTDTSQFQKVTQEKAVQISARQKLEHIVEKNIPKSLQETLVETE